MALIVQKFGGTSVGNIERIRNVANRVKKEIDSGNQVVVVVSAMSGTTDQLVDWAKELSPLTSKSELAEYDTIVASGEQVTSGLLALALQTIGVPARSWLGWQVHLTTDETHSKARIGDVHPHNILESLQRGEVAVVAGFQGIEPESNRVTTLGRGGSDTSAVALAAALKADRCDIYTDVDGVYTTDPRIVSKAKKLHKVAYEEMLEMASLGAKVLQTRSVEMAMKHHVRVQVLSSFDDIPGTLLVDEEEIMERRLITGITYNRNEAQITLAKVPDHPGVAALLFAPLAAAEVNVDMIIQNISDDGKETNITFTLSRADIPAAKKALEDHKASLGYKSLIIDTNVAKVSVVGVGMRSHVGLAQQMFQTLADRNINIRAITTSEIKISVLIDEEYTELAIRSLHTAFGLDANEERP